MALSGINLFLAMTGQEEVLASPRVAPACAHATACALLHCAGPVQSLHAVRLKRHTDPELVQRPSFPDVVPRAGEHGHARHGMACIAPCCALHGLCRVWHVAYWQRRMRAVWRCRVQNEYGAKIAGPLPRSFMRSQWALQKQILQRSRALGMSAQLPGAPHIIVSRAARYLERISCGMVSRARTHAPCAHPRACAPRAARVARVRADIRARAHEALGGAGRSLLMPQCGTASATRG